METRSKNLHFSELWGILTAPSHPYYQREYLLHTYYQLVISRQIFIPTSSVTQQILCEDLAGINSFSFSPFPIQSCFFPLENLNEAENSGAPGCSLEKQPWLCIRGWRNTPAREKNGINGDF